MQHAWCDKNTYTILVGRPKGQRRILKWNLYGNTVGGSEVWINLAKDKNQWRAFVNAVMNLWAPWKVRNFLSNWAYCLLLKDFAPLSLSVKSDNFLCRVCIAYSHTLDRNGKFLWRSLTWSSSSQMMTPSVHLRLATWILLHSNSWQI